MKVIKHRNSISSRIELLVSIPRGVLIDIETTDTDEEIGEIITLGFILRNELTIIQRRVKDKQPFYKEISSKVAAMPRPFYAYNSEFEEKFFRKHLGIRLTGIDLMKPWKKLAEHRFMKWPKLDELISEPEIYFGVTRISSGDIPSLWNAFLSSGDEKILEMIMKHNKADILRELYLLVQYPHLYELEREKIG